MSKINLVNTKHGLCKNPLYQIWNTIKQRCTNPNYMQYKNYGGRGITVCSKWKDNPANFIQWYEKQENHDKEGYTLDRRNNDGNYEPENCRFTSRHIQNTNQRKPNTNTSGYVGISYDKGYKKWRASLMKNNKQLLQKHFPTKQAALECRNNFILDNNLREYKLQAWGNA